ncbi:MAG: DUF5947 family protein, partial [Acidimicrobiales bacterium]
VAHGRALCVCVACSLLFDRAEAGGGRYHLVPERRFPVDGADPSLLGVPVGLAFFVQSEGGQVYAHYPSPAGATRWEVSPGDWEAAARRCPALSGLAREVEALLVDTTRDRSEAWVVPISDCYRLVATVRQQWEGMYGGDRVRESVAGFFDNLRRSDGTVARR